MLTMPNNNPLPIPLETIKGSTSQNKEINNIYKSLLTIDNNILSTDLYKYSIAIIRYAFAKRPLKEILPIAKEIYKQGMPIVNYNISIMAKANWTDIEKVYNQIKENDLKVIDSSTVKANDTKMLDGIKKG